MKWGLITCLILIIFFFSQETITTSRHVQNIEYYSGVNSSEILKNVDIFLEKHAEMRRTTTTWDELYAARSTNLSKIKKKRLKNAPGFSTDYSQLPTSIKELWSKTSMLFGATANGLGIGTTFMSYQYDNNTALFFTAMHVVDDFCKFPENIPQEVGEYPCSNLFVMHDVAIDTVDNSVTEDGLYPWKSSVDKIIYFDRVNDFAAFLIPIKNVEELTAELPTDPFGDDFIDPRATLIDSDFDVKKPYFKSEALYSVGFPSTYRDVADTTVADKQLIRKRWTQGNYNRTLAFESDAQAGFSQVLSHNLNMLPGLSGSVLSLEDGRVVGMNIALLFNQKIIKRMSGCTKKIDLKEYRLALPLVNVSGFLKAQKGKLLPAD